MSHSPARDRCRGIAAVEFALMLPAALLVMLATADLAAYLRTKMRLEQTASGLAGLVTQYTQLYSSDGAVFFTASQTLAGATPVTGTLGATIISGIVNNGSGATIAWQLHSPEGVGFTSQFGVQGTAPVLPDSYQLPGNTSVIGVEIYTTATPWVRSAFLMGPSANQVLRAYALYQPRSALLSQIARGNRP